MKRTNGFTLLEVLVSVGIFLMIAGGIYSAVSVGITTSNELGMARLESERWDAFQRFMRKMFLSLPPSSRVELRTRDRAGRGRVVELLLDPAPEFARFSRQAEASGVVLSVRPSENETYELALANFDGQREGSGRDEQIDGASWIPLIAEIEELRWRFAASNERGLHESWDLNNGRPGLAELSIRRRGEKAPRILYFGIPRLEDPKLRQASPKPEATPQP